MKIDADGHIIEGEGSAFVLWGECQLTIQIAVPQNASFTERDALFATYGFSFGKKTAVQRKMDFLCI